jgi:hypothetical protein
VVLLYEIAASGWLTPYRAGALTLEANGQWPVVSGQFLVGAFAQAKIN